MGRRGVLRPTHWLLVAAALVATATGFASVGLPSPFLLAAFAVGIADALFVRPPLSVVSPAATAAQGVIGVTAGSYLDRTTVASVGQHVVPIVGVSVLTVLLSVVAGLALARFSRVDRATAAFGMIAGGAAGIIALSRELGADQRLVAVMQYLRVLIIVAVTPVVAVGIFGMSGRSRSAMGGSFWSTPGIAYVACVVGLGLVVARQLRLPGGSILGPMLTAATVSLVYRPLVSATPIALADVAFAFIGLDVGLRFTRESLREAGALVPRSVIVIVAMLFVSAASGVVLALTTGVSMLDGYLATTPGGLTAVVALAVGGRTNTTFIISVQVIRTFLMLAAAPVIARSLAARGDGAF